MATRYRLNDGTIVDQPPRYQLLDICDVCGQEYSRRSGLLVEWNPWAAQRVGVGVHYRCLDGAFALLKEQIKALVVQLSPKTRPEALAEELEEMGLDPEEFLDAFWATHHG